MSEVLSQEKFVLRGWPTISLLVVYPALHTLLLTEATLESVLGPSLVLWAFSCGVAGLWAWHACPRAHSRWQIAGLLTVSLLVTRVLPRVLLRAP